MNGTILPGDQRVLHDRRRGRDRIGAQRADMDEGAGGELEILDHAAGEDDALQRIRCRSTNTPASPMQ